MGPYFGWEGVGGGVWSIILGEWGEWGWVGHYSGWVGVDGDEWGWMGMSRGG